jgi:hypothetical protein
MKRAVGRNIYVTSLHRVLISAGGAAKLAARCKDSQLSALWVRVGRGPGLDKNFTTPEMAAFRTELDQTGVELWGWHVPFCANAAAANDEADKVVKWANDFDLAGVLLDAEKTTPDPRFLGKAPEAEIYAGKVQAGLSAKGRGIALSSHDQPSLHTDLPFESFLKHVADSCPQVYYRTANVTTRLNKSIHDYKVVEAARDFKDRYKPTGNITMSDDVPLPDVPTCLAATKNFIAAVKAGGYHGYSFWCMDTAPDEIWPLFKQTPV